MFLLYKRLAVFLFVAAIAQPLCGMESTTEPRLKCIPLTDKVDEYINACVELKKFNGAILVAQGGAILVNKGYGSADFEHHIPCTPTTKFRLGSITKQFTAMAIMILQERGRLSVSDPISKYIPLTEFPWGDRITIYHCLTNTPGLQDYANCPNSNFCKTNEFIKFHTATEIISFFKDAPLEFEPGSKYEYCNSGWVLLTAIIERISETSYEAFLQDNIFGPLGMTNSCIDSLQRDIAGRACGYTRKGGNIVPAAFTDISWTQGAGILLSTLEDMYLWDRALYTTRLLSKISLDTMLTPYKDVYACGWVSMNLFGKKLVWHNGGLAGCSSCFYRFIDDDVCIIVLSNLDTVDQDQICEDLSAIVFGKPYAVPRAKKPITVDPVIFDSYVGKYRLVEGDCLRLNEGDGLIVSVTKESDKLYAQVTGADKSQLCPESATDFFDIDSETQVSFVKNSEGQATRLIVHHTHGEDVAEKI